LHNEKCRIEADYVQLVSQEGLRGGVVRKKEGEKHEVAMHRTGIEERPERSLNTPNEVLVKVLLMKPEMLLQAITGT
jgi:hypothetical protein